jgi:hypothetical protein
MPLDSYVSSKTPIARLCGCKQRHCSDVDELKILEICNILPREWTQKLSVSNLASKQHSSVIFSGIIANNVSITIGLCSNIDCNSVFVQDKIGSYCTQFTAGIIGCLDKSCIWSLLESIRGNSVVIWLCLPWPWQPNSTCPQLGLRERMW